MSFKSKKCAKALAVLLSSVSFMGGETNTTYANDKINLLNVQNSKNSNQIKNKFSLIDWIKKNPKKSALIGISSILGLAIAGFGTYKAVSYIKNKTKFKETTEYGINKFGYNATEDCVYKRKNGKINVVIIGSSAEKRKQFIDDIKNNKKVRSHNCNAEEYKGNGGLADCIEFRISKWPANDIHHLCVSEERAKFSNWNIIEKDLNNDSADEIANLLKNDVAMAVFMIDDEDNKDKIREIFLKSLVSNVQWEGDTKYSYLDKGHPYGDFIGGPAYIPTGFIFKNMKNNKNNENNENNENNKFDEITPINGMAKNFIDVLKAICDDGRIFYNSKDHNYDIGRGFDS